MNRRAFIIRLGSAAAGWPLAARAQSERVRRVGILFTLAESDPDAQARLAAIKDGLKQKGWIEGRNIAFQVRWGAGDGQRIERYAAELVRARPDVITGGATAVAVALKKETSDIPVVFAQVSDPVRLGLVQSLAKPGGNITGFADYDESIAVKWLEILKQIAPDLTHVGALYDPANPSWAGFVRAVEAGGKSLGVRVATVAVHNRDDIERAITGFGREPNGGLVILQSPLLGAQRDLVIALADRYRLPNMHALRYYPVSGGLASYGIDNIDLYRGAALYVDRILRGQKPRDLPVQEATKFRLILNLKAAKTLALTIPPSLLARADEVIE